MNSGTTTRAPDEEEFQEALERLLDRDDRIGRLCCMRLDEDNCETLTNAAVSHADHQIVPPEHDRDPGCDRGCAPDHQTTLSIAAGLNLTIPIHSLTHTPASGGFKTSESR